MAGSIVQYITDHTAAGECTLMHYQGKHDNSRCTIPPGYCSMNAYLVVLLKNAEAAGNRGFAGGGSLGGNGYSGVLPVSSPVVTPVAPQSLESLVETRADWKGEAR
jgi:hypothetical protein